MASGSEAYAGVNAGRKSRKKTTASTRSPKRSTGNTFKVNNFPIF